MSTLGKNIKNLRGIDGSTQEQLAQAIKTSREALAKWETGKAVPTADSIIALADYFGVTTDYLFGRDTPSQKTEYDINKEVSEAARALNETVAEIVSKGYMTEEEGTERLRFMEEYIRRMYLSGKKT